VREGKKPNKKDGAEESKISKRFERVSVRREPQVQGKNFKINEKAYEEGGAGNPKTIVRLLGRSVRSGKGRTFVADR